MEESTLYDILQRQKVDKWQEELEAREEYFLELQKIEREREKDLKGKLSEGLAKDLQLYAAAIENRIEYLYYNLLVKVMNMGVRMGMDLQSAFHAEEK